MQRGSNTGKMQSELKNICGDEKNGGFVIGKKRVMVVVDDSTSSKQAMMWALTHVTNKGDLLTLLQILPSNSNRGWGSGVEGEGSVFDSSTLATSLGSLCKASKPEVEVEALVIQGRKLGTVMSQVKKLEVSVLVLGQTKASPFITWLCGRKKKKKERFVEKCIENVECLTLGVRKQSHGIGGYLISTRWKKDFWLLA